MYDERLFNQDKGMSSGFATDDQYNVYDKGLFTTQPTLSTLYRPKKDVDNEVYGGADEQLKKIMKTDRFNPDKGFTGASERAAPSDRPVEFESGEADLFGIDQFIIEVKKGMKALDNVDVSKTFVELPPELCSIIMSPISVNTPYSFSFIPSIMHRLESFLGLGSNDHKVMQGDLSLRASYGMSLLILRPGSFLELNQVVLIERLKCKVVADVVEALIGAFLSAGGEMAALLFMDWMGIKGPFAVSRSYDAWFLHAA
ncbi:SNW domain-containing protein 1-like [Trifolium pratense]|uniref:SNW domain-containing protein 1-like n=1 Tax=Trifolium pratense TaxID=57577 RepID=A0A2K3LA23_TRIPR|nr:SNW domain-containing protein 1-like [Trifolium pratense]